MDDKNSGGRKMKFSMKYVILYVNNFKKIMDFYKGILGLPIKL